jgi:hypothetical protein
MSDRDPLIDLLHSADGVFTPPGLSPNLPPRVRARRARQVARNKRLAIGSAAIVVVAIALVALFQPWQPPAPPGGGGPQNLAVTQRPPAEPGATGQKPVISSLPDADLAALRAESDRLAAEAGALEREIRAARLEQTRQDVREEYRRQLAANIDADTAQSPIDRAAAIALCQGDFYWEVQQNRVPAQAAYQSILDNFPNSPLASVAQARLQQLQMN